MPIVNVPITASRSYGTPLRHAQFVHFDRPLALELDGALPGVTVAYEAYGTLAPGRDNAILICHSLSGDSHVAGHEASDDPGWWDILVGPGLAIDTSRFFVICANVLGGCRGTTGPVSINPATGRPFGRDFPWITIGDMVEVQRRLLDHLGIDRLHAVVGGSMGGHQVLQWATAHPARIARALVFASSARLTAQALAFDIIGRTAILAGGEGATDEQLARGLAIARMLGHITFLSPEALAAQCGDRRAADSTADVKTDLNRALAVGAYLLDQGARFVQRFDPLSFVSLTSAMDLFDLEAGGLDAALAPATCRWLLVSFTSDWLFPPAQLAQIAEALRRVHRSVTYSNIHTASGHDAFLLAEDVPLFAPLVRNFLQA